MKLLVFSDIHGDKSALEKLVNTEADYYFADGDLTNWGRGLDQLGPIMQKRADRIYVLPGNHESEADIARFCEQFGFHNFHGQTLQIGNLTVAGLGYSNPTPFDTPGEYSEQELAARLDKFSSLDPLILICHTPPKSTKLDRVREGQHFGSQAVRDFIERRQPLYFFCGHIHEAAGVQDTFGRTQGWNVGKRGHLLDLDDLLK
ncbi:MAG TPA: metallophosphoesterase [Bryobacteraceae bacterium]|nr:metallophosphoesterase [Bryobacteraceae bacterium]